ncbi:MAG: D-alanine--D-alanine ligase family protein [Bdellovibrionota bacterium]
MGRSKKIRVAVLFGGRSGEHEVSLRSAASVMQHMDKERFEVVPVTIDKYGRWRENGKEVVFPPYPNSAVLNVDVVFPVIHGPLCEDGTIQGLLELAEVPYVGCGVLASAVGMDKDVAKRLARDAGVAVVPYLCLTVDEWKNSPAVFEKLCSGKLGYPVFIKPANLGSSVGVHKVHAASELASSLEDAFQYDLKVLVERAINAREIEVAVLESADPSSQPIISVPGEVCPTHEFYSYEAKYLDENGASLNIPADLTPEQVQAARDMAAKVFASLCCEGMARADLFLERGSGVLYFNEINTIPGFTSISMYPKMMEASGIAYGELLSRLIDLAIARHKRKKQLLREFADITRLP